MMYGWSKRITIDFVFAEKSVNVIGCNVGTVVRECLCSIDMLLIGSSEVLPENFASRRLWDLRNKLDPTNQVLVWGEGSSDMTL